MLDCRSWPIDVRVTSGVFCGARVRGCDRHASLATETGHYRKRDTAFKPRMISLRDCRQIEDCRPQLAERVTQPLRLGDLVTLPLALVRIDLTIRAMRHGPAPAWPSSLLGRGFVICPASQKPLPLPRRRAVAVRKRGSLSRTRGNAAWG